MRDKAMLAMGRLRVDLALERDVLEEYRMHLARARERGDGPEAEALDAWTAAQARTVDAMAANLAELEAAYREVYGDEDFAPSPDGLDRIAA